MSDYKLSATSIRRMQGVDTRLVSIAHRAIEITPIDFGIPNYGGVRTDQEQYQLFLQGKSVLDGHRKMSRHQRGEALDVFAYVHHKASWKEVYLALIATAFFRAANELGHKIEWGGHWGSITPCLTTDNQEKLILNGVDMPHFQLSQS